MPDITLDDSQRDEAMIDTWDPMAEFRPDDADEDATNVKTKEVVKKVNVGKEIQTRGKKSMVEHRFGNLALAVRKDTPIVKEVKRG